MSFLVLLINNHFHNNNIQWIIILKKEEFGLVIFINKIIDYIAQIYSRFEEFLALK